MSADRTRRPIGVTARDWEQSRAQAAAWDDAIKRLDAQVAWLQVGVFVLFVTVTVLAIVVIL